MRKALTAHVGTLQASLAMREEQLATVRASEEAASRTLAELLQREVDAQVEASAARAAAEAMNENLLESHAALAAAELEDAQRAAEVAVAGGRRERRIRARARLARRVKAACGGHV